MKKILFSLLLLVPFAVAQTGTIPSNFFGLHYKTANGFPQVRFGSVRLWDSGTRWQTTNTNSTTWSFTNLDAYLSAAKTNGKDVLLTLSATPQWISSDPNNASCAYAAGTGVGNTNGSCGVPTDIAATCTNVNALNNCDGRTDGTNQSWRNNVWQLGNHIAGLNPASFATVSSFEVWNEFTNLSTGIYVSWEGANAFATTQPQLVRMAQDANCILTGRGAGCTAAAMGVASVGMLPSAVITTSDSVMTAPNSTMWGQYLSTTGALAAADVAAVHAYTQGGGCCAYGETAVTRYNTALTNLTAAGGNQPIWSTEGGYGQQSPSEPDPDLQAAFVARYYLTGWTAGFARLYWYAYDSPTFGTLWIPDNGTTCINGGLGCITTAGKAYDTTYGWMVGNVMSTPCSVTVIGNASVSGTAMTWVSGGLFDTTWVGSINFNGGQFGIASVNSTTSITLTNAPTTASNKPFGTVWTCGLSAPGAARSNLVVWDTGRTCASGTCTTVPYTYPAGASYASYSSLDGTTTSISGATVPIGAKPIMINRLLSPAQLSILGVGF